MKDINLIWQTNKGDASTFEYEYITEILFKNFKQNKFFDHATHQTFLDNSVIIYSKDSVDNTPISEEFLNYLDKFKEKKYNFYLLHLSNEHPDHDTWYYKKAKHVFRNYYFKEIADKHDNITFIPLGFKSGFIKNKNLIDLKKDLDFCFIGAFKKDRSELVGEIIKYKHFLHRTYSWNCPTSLTQEQVKNIYEKTKFVPCPMGNTHVDSFRICESMESGSIPIMKLYNNEDYSNIIFPNNPFPKVKEWSDIEKILSKYNKKEDYDNLFNEVMGYYENFKKSLINKIYNIIK
jgi:hypothetical protein